MSDLAAFLAARLDKDEALARALEGSAGLGQWDVEPGGDRGIVAALIDLRTGLLARFTDRQAAAHIARHDPARVLREVEAKRKILAGHKIGSHPEVRTIEHHDKQWNTGSIERNETGRTLYWCQTCDYDRDFGYIGDAREGCDTVRALAAVYSDHPDYKLEWRP